MAFCSNILSRAYAKLSSVRTSVYLLAALAVIFALGKTSSYAYFALSLLLLLNLIVCAIARFSWITSRKDSFSGRITSPSLILNVRGTAAYVKDIMPELIEKNLGFKYIGSKNGVYRFERGIYYRWLTWTYHAAIIGCFMGFLLTGLFVRDGYFTLKKGIPAEIKSEEEESRGWLVKKDVTTPGFKLVLEDFRTEYYAHPALDYPKDIKTKLAIALGWKDFEAQKNAENIFPKDWLSKLKVMRNNTAVAEKTIEVNDPLKFEGYTFYQAFYKQTLKLLVNGSLHEVEAGMNSALTHKSLKSAVTLGTLRNGVLFTDDGKQNEFTPYVMLTVTPQNADSAAKQKIKLTKKDPVIIDGTTIRLLDFEESSILSYRYDPGVPLLWCFGTIMFIVLTIRCFASWHSVMLMVEESNGQVRLFIEAESKGIGADTSTLLNRLSKLFENPDIGRNAK